MGVGVGIGVGDDNPVLLKGSSDIVTALCACNMTRRCIISHDLEHQEIMVQKIYSMCHQEKINTQMMVLMLHFYKLGYAISQRNEAINGEEARK